MKASVAIATFRRKALLEKLIVALEHQTIAHDDYEIIVCDSGSNDGTSEMIGQMSAKFGNIRYINLAINTLSSKRNVGTDGAQAPIVIFIDDDVLPDKGFVEAHLNAHEGAIDTVFCGMVRFPEELVRTSNYFRFRDSRHPGPDRPDIRDEDMPHQNMSVMNLSFRKAEILKVGYVSEAFTRYGGEDHDFAYRIHKAGLRIALVRDALIFHYEAGGNVEQYSRKLYYLGRYGFGVLNRLHPEYVNLTKYKYLEPVQQVDSYRLKAAKLIVRVTVNPFFAYVIRKFLIATDSIPCLYFPRLFRYVFASDYKQGTFDRRESDGESVPGDTNGYSWFEKMSA